MPTASPPEATLPDPVVRRSRVLLLAVALYLGLGACALASGHALLAVAAVYGLIVALLVPALRRGRCLAWLGLFVIGALLAWLMRIGAGWLLMDLVPVLVNLGLCVLFARTLRQGHEPLIARFIAILEGRERLRDPAVARYARGLTRAWALVLGLQALVLGLIVAFMPHGLLHVLGMGGPRLTATFWLAYLHAGSYGLVAGFMLFEYGWRRWQLRHLEHMGLVKFLLAVVHRWPALLRSLSDPRHVAGP
ncbi:xanthomonadin biosynthesis protein [Dokdonella sp.]|uniref:xanthomonadin biosynthesis protein n=1 Tax=Dokdonella sp. TaxID=2291710 RepID=UPI0025C6FCEC|nr:xanthomonadin biosynthesis protein [Dokdonella sp.]MBX3687989.1 xanthomonadin biosynthesis protein [Dokdonella sp.]